jgi:hypothetical protein
MFIMDCGKKINMRVILVGTNTKFLVSINEIQSQVSSFISINEGTTKLTVHFLMIKKIAYHGINCII